MQGLSEPVGALVALLIVKPFLNEDVVHYLLAFVGGIMVRLPGDAQPGSTALCSASCNCFQVTVTWAEYVYSGWDDIASSHLGPSNLV